jgi:hypothetical protein
MPASVHKILLHGSETISAALLEGAKSSEQRSEEISRKLCQKNLERERRLVII